MLKILVLNRSFRSLWIGQLISALGDRFTQMGILTFLMVSGQDKGDKVALITFFGLLPFFAFSPLFGALVDQYSRKSLMILAEISRAILVSLIPFVWLNTHSVPVMIAWFFVLGSLNALFTPAKMSIITNITAKESLLQANSLIITTGMVATLVGTFIAGVVIKAAGVKSAFYINGLTYFISAVLIFQIVYKRQVSKKTVFTNVYKNLSGDIKTGARYIFRHRIILRLIVLASSLSCISSFAYILILNYGSQVLKQNSLGIGCMLSTAGLGMIVGSLILLKKKDTVNYGRILSLAFAVIGGCCLLVMIRPRFNEMLAILFFSGIGSAIATIALDTVFHRITPDDLKGKIFAARSIVTSLAFLLSLLVVGALVKYLDVILLFVLVGAFGLFVALRVILYEKEWGYLLFRFFLRSILKLYFGFKVEGLRNLPKSRKIILAGNHTSLLDGVVLMCAYPGRVYFLAAESLFKTRPWGWMAKHLGYLPIKRGGFNKETIKEAVGIIKSGSSIGIFPEGRITPDGRLAEGKEGVALIARLAGADIVPFAIEGVYEAWPISKKYPSRFPISVRFSRPVNIKDHPVREELLQDLMQEIGSAKLRLEREGYLKVEPDEIVKYILNVK